MSYASDAKWSVFAASSIGKAHIDSGLPNQDAYFVNQTDDITVAVVCDGAGSARFSQDGAKFFSQSIGNFLQSSGSQLLEQKASVSQIINEQLATIRQNLASQIASDSSLRDYHATVTAVIVFHQANQALLIQVGDSPLITSRFVVENNHVDYFADLRFYGDDSKNEYVNETHFITQDDWQNLLRCEWLELTQVDLVALMSDGCADLVIEGAKMPRTIYRPFFGNVIFNLCASASGVNANQMLEQAIADSATYRLTGDDKTLVVLLKNNSQYLNIEPVLSVENTNNDNINAKQATTEQVTSTNSVWHSGSTSEQGQVSTVQIINVPQNLQENAIQSTSASLPPASSVSDTTKQRRNTAVIAGVAALIGAGTLGWINLHKSEPNQQASQNPIAASQSASSPMINTTIDTTKLEAVQLADPYFVQPMQINNTTANFEVMLALPMNYAIQGIPTSASQAQAINTSTSQLDYQFIAKTAIIDVQPSTTKVNLAEAAASTANIAEPTANLANIKIQAKPVCERYDNVEQLNRLGIVTQNDWQYIHCIVQAQPIENKNQVASFTQPIEEWQLLNGLVNLFEIKPIKSSRKPASPVASTTDIETALQLYYLPKVTKTAATSSTASATASSPTHQASTPKG